MIRNKCFLLLKILYISVFAVAVLVLYVIHLDRINTVWQLGDEAGYLWPCAHLCGLNWDSIASDSFYFGFGYGVILLPVFFITHTGIDLIRGACFINILCVMACYFCMVKTMTLFSETDSKNNLFIPCFAFAICGMPFFSSFVYKVKPECELAMLFCLSLLLLYYSLIGDSVWYSIGFGIIVAYMFFVHARTLAITIVAFMIFTIMMIKKRLSVKKVVSFYSSYGLIIVMGSIIKTHLINYKKSLVPDTKLVNASVDSEYVFERIYSLFGYGIKGISQYLACFFSKVFYSLYASCFFVAVLVFFLIFLIRRENVYDAKDICGSARKICIIYLLSSWIITLALMTVRGTGGDLRYFMYGRYYEYMLPIIVCIGVVCIYVLLNNKKHLMGLFLAWIFLGIIVSIMMSFSLSDTSLFVDNERLSALSWAIERSNSVEDVVTLMICEISLFISLCFIMPRNWINSMILSFLIVFFLNSSFVDAQLTFEKNKESIADTMIAEYVCDKNENVFMLDDHSYRYDHFYSRMQVLLRDKPLHVISEDDLNDIPSNDYILFYVTSPLINDIDDKYIEIAKGSSVYLYQKTND